MSIHALVDSQAVQTALELAGEEIRHQRFLGEIMVSAGKALLMRYRWSDDGKQIQADICFDGRNGPVRQALERAGGRVGLPGGWVDHVLPRLFGDGQSVGGGFPTGMYPSWERPGLRVLAAPLHLLIPMAFLATLRPMGDMSMGDLDPFIRITAQSGINTSRRLEALIAPYVNNKRNRDDHVRDAVDRRLEWYEIALERLGCGLTLGAKPKSLAEVAAVAREDGDLFPLASFAFRQAFYVATDRDAQQAMLDPVPDPTGNAKGDAWIGAIGEHLAQRWGLEVPSWTQDPAFMGEAAPSFWPYDPRARDIQLIETPPAFRRRLLFSQAEPLMDAKFPNAKKVRMPFWE
jgi:hypothetical protein